jgi:Zn-dependent M28 family amino/carboxypeptidase
MRNVQTLALQICVVMMCTLGAQSCATSPRTLTPDPALSSYGDTVRLIQKEAISTRGAYEKLIELCDGIGHRLSGSAALERAVKWAVETMNKEGHEGVRAEPVKIPKWTRGAESLQLVHPRKEPLVVLGLGGSVGTPDSGLEAQVVVVEDEAGLEKVANDLKGKIVLFNNRMPDYHPERGTGYGQTVRFRVHGADMAAKHGAVAILVRSVTARSLRTPHTGTLRYEDRKKGIPAAAVTTEDAELMARMQKKGTKIVVKLKMGAQYHGLVDGANVIGELRGRERPDEVVVIGGHLDSWDVGQGAHDDGTGVVMAMETLTLLKRLNLRPRRTIRVVLWTNEENGLRGGKAYAAQYKAKLEKHIAAIESDSGGFEPVGFSLEHKDQAKQSSGANYLRRLVSLYSELGPMKISTGFSGADIRPMKDAGVWLMGLRVDMKSYFDIHHTPADTVDKVKPEELQRCVASMAAMAWLLAELPTPFQ